MLNSSPCSGRKVSAPVIPNKPNNPIAQAGQAGAMMAVAIPNAPAGRPEDICLRSKKMLPVTTIPPKTEMTIISIRAEMVRLARNPYISENNNLNENWFQSNL